MLISNFILSRVAPVMLVCGAGVVSAQVLPAKPAKPKVENQVPTTKDGIENAVKTGEKVVAPVPQVVSEKLKLMRERAALVTENNAQFHKAVMAGDLLPFEALRKKYTNEFPAQLANVQELNAAFTNEKDADAKKRIGLALQKALSVVGPYLQASEYGSADMTLTEKQHAELVRLQKLDPPTKVGEKGTPMMVADSDHLTFTMLHVPVSMQVQAEPNAIVYFTTDGGGEFGNGIPMQEVKADEKGIATASWVSKGDSVGVAGITVTSPTSRNPVFYRIEVVGLTLKALPKMPELKSQKAAAEALKKRLETLKKERSNHSK